MKIRIMGAGSIGTILARKLTAAGHGVKLGGRTAPSEI
jgi:hypothetical protein